MHKSLFKAAIIIGGAGLFASPALAADYEFTTATNPTVAPGLVDSVYHLGQNESFDTSASDSSITSVVNYAATNAPNYSFQNVADTFLYNPGNVNPTDELATNAFLGADAAGAAALDTTPIETSIFDAEGLIQILTPGVYTFDSSGADDAVRLYLGGNGTPGSGTAIFERNYNFFSNPPTVYTGPITVQFDQAGYYPFEAFYYNEYSGGSGSAQLELSVTPSQGLAPVSYATAVPEPASLLALPLVAGLLLKRRGN